jgi:hypothetical protein
MDRDARRKEAGAEGRAEFEGALRNSRARFYLAHAKRIRELAQIVATASAREDFELIAVKYEWLAAQVAALEKFGKR